jgi:hypothetical protein
VIVDSEAELISSHHRVVVAAVLNLIVPVLTAQRLPRHTVDVQLDFSGREAQTSWVNGYFPRFNAAWGNSKPIVWMLDRNGKTVIPKTEIWFPEAFHVEVRAVTADVVGNLYASVEVWSNSKDGIGAICKVSARGDPIRVTRTDEFLALAIAATRGGEVWGFGLPILLQTKRTTTDNYMTIARIDRSGRLIDRMLPRSTFGPEVIPTLGYGDVGMPHLWATSSRVGLYVPTTGRWIEFDPTTGAKLLDITAVRPTADDGKKAAVIDLVMTESDGHTYAFFNYVLTKDQSHQPGLYELDKSSERWVRIPDRGAAEEFRGLFGADGDDLVLRAGTKTFGWVPAPSLRGSRNGKEIH